MPLVIDDFEAIQKGVNDTSGQVRALWIGFLSLTAYLAISAGSVTHRMLFEETPLKLPILNVDLPLVGFFIVGPFFFIVFHFYLLLQTVTLAKTIALYNETLVGAVSAVQDRDKVRRRLDGFVVVKMLAGPGSERGDLDVRLTRLVAVLTMVVLPIALLVQIELAFLPYHNALVTWFHRFLVILDLLLLWSLWPAISRVEHQVRLRAPSRKDTMHVFAVFVVLFSVFVATFPGEGVHELLSVRGFSVADAIFGGKVGGVKGTPDRLFSNILVLADQKFVDDEKLEKSEHSISVRGRDLRGAILVRADLRKADFTGAKLDYAVFDNARLAEATFACADLPIPNVASQSIFGELHLNGEHAPAHRWPDDRCTWLTGASFVRAGLQGANFEKARLQSALFAGAQMQGARLVNAEAQGASFFGAKLDGASLESATLFGASFNSAKLRGASLANAALAGASLFNASLDGATLSGANVYRVHQFPKSTQYADLTNLQFDAPPGSSELDKWTDEQVADLPPRVAAHVRERLSSMKPDPVEDKKFVVPKSEWDNAAATPHGVEFEKSFVTMVVRLACETEFSQYIAPGLVRNGRLGTAGALLASIVAILKDKKQCLGTAGLKASELAKLDELLNPWPQPIPKNDSRK